MKTFILFLSCFILIPLYAQETVTPVLSTTKEVDEDEKSFNPRKGHWVTNFGFESLEYEVPLDFMGEKKSFSDKKQALYGGRLGLGREFYLGKSFITSTKVEGYYVGTLFEKALSANPEEDVEFAFTKTTGQVYGVDAVQTFGYLFDMKTKNPFLDEMTYLTVEPFIEAGIGMARAYNRINYHYDTDVQEDYRHRIEDEIMATRLGVGVNFTSSEGYFFSLRAAQTRFDITKRDEKRYVKQDGQPAESFTSDSKDLNFNVTVYSVGGGYKF